jgi:hypothetical protein
MTAMTRATTQPIKVQPSRTLTTATAVTRCDRRVTATIVGTKYTKKDKRGTSGWIVLTSRLRVSVSQPKGRR